MLIINNGKDPFALPRNSGQFFLNIYFEVWFFFSLGTILFAEDLGAQEGTSMDNSRQQRRT
jgi:hypothetical protein